MSVIPAVARALNEMEKQINPQWQPEDFEKLLLIETNRTNILNRFEELVNDKRCTSYQNKVLNTQFKKEVQAIRDAEASEADIITAQQRKEKALADRKNVEKLRKDTLVNKVASKLKSIAQVNRLKKIKTVAGNSQSIVRGFLARKKFEKLAEAHTTELEMVALFRDPSKGEEYTKTIDQRPRQTELLKELKQKKTELAENIDQLRSKILLETAQLDMQPSIQMAIEAELRHLMIAVADNKNLSEKQQQSLEKFVPSMVRTGRMIGGVGVTATATATAALASIAQLESPAMIIGALAGLALTAGVERFTSRSMSKEKAKLERVIQDATDKSQILQKQINEKQLKNQASIDIVAQLQQSIDEIHTEIADLQSQINKASEDYQTQSYNTQEIKNFREDAAKAHELVTQHTDIMHNYAQQKLISDGNLEKINQLPMPLSYAVLHEDMKDGAVKDPESVTAWLKHNVKQLKVRILSSEDSAKLIKQLKLIAECGLDKTQQQYAHEIMAQCVRNALIDAYPIKASAESTLFQASKAVVSTAASDIIYALASDEHAFERNYFDRTPPNPKTPARVKTLENFVVTLNTIKDTLDFDPEQFAESFKTSFNLDQEPQSFYASSYGLKQGTFDDTQLGLKEYITQEFQKIFAQYKSSKNLEVQLEACSLDRKEREFVSIRMDKDKNFVSTMIDQQKNLSDFYLSNLSELEKHYKSLNVAPETIKDCLKEAMERQLKAADESIQPEKNIALLKDISSDMVDKAFAKLITECLEAIENTIKAENMQVAIIPVVTSLSELLEVKASPVPTSWENIYQWIVETYNAIQRAIMSWWSSTFSARLDDGQDSVYSERSVGYIESFDASNSTDELLHSKPLTKESLLEHSKRFTSRPSSDDEQSTVSSLTDNGIYVTNHYVAGSEHAGSIKSTVTSGSQAETVKATHLSNIAEAGRGNTTTTIEFSDRVSIADSSDFESVDSSSEHVNADHDGLVLSASTNSQDQNKQIRFSSSSSSSSSSSTKIASGLNKLRDPSLTKGSSGSTNS